jgi:endonuclease/exonuclease/phosphatase family metal-dependent hydrolase
MHDRVPPPHSRRCLRVATLDLWGHFADWPRRRALLEAQLPAYEIDVYLFQEVACDDAGVDQLHELADLFGYEWTTRVVAESRPHEREHEGVAILSRLPLSASAVWPLPPSRPARHLLQASLDWQNRDLSLFTLHAAVTGADGRDEQLRALAGSKSDPLLLGADLNAPPALVRPLLGERLRDACAWDETPTWPVSATQFVHAWQAKLGQPPSGDPEPRRLDYLLYRGLAIAGSGTLALGNGDWSASDHRLVWADLAASP